MKRNVNQQLYDPAKLYGGRIYIDTPGYPDNYRLIFMERAQKLAPQLKPQLLAARDDPHKLVKWQRDFHLVDPWVKRLLNDDGVRAATAEQVEALLNFIEKFNSKAAIDEESGLPVWTEEYGRTIEREHLDAWYYLLSIGFDTPKTLHFDIIFTPFERLGDFKKRAHKKLDEIIDAHWPKLVAEGLKQGMEKATYKRRGRGRTAPFEHYDDLVAFQVLGKSSYEIAGSSMRDDDARRNAHRNIHELAELLGLTLRPASKELENMIPQDRRAYYARRQILSIKP